MPVKIVYVTYPSGYKKVTSVDGFSIASDKHAYKCKRCGAIFQSKNIYTRGIFPTDDPRCKNCDDVRHDYLDLEKVCECDPIV